MKPLNALFLSAMLATAGPAAATDAAIDPVAAWQADPGTPVDATDISLEQFRWIARPIVVFADTPADPRLQQQLDLLAQRPEALIERDVVVIVDTDPAARSAVRTALRPRGFMLAVLAKDGTVTLRKPFPWDVRELSRSIDKLPLRQQELRDARRALQ